jgi:hypothetical protein
MSTLFTLPNVLWYAGVCLLKLWASVETAQKIFKKRKDWLQ